jgi:hypothetical protein
VSEADEELIQDIEKLLETYTLEEILELADVTPAYALFLLVTAGEFDLPELRPV